MFGIYIIMIIIHYSFSDNIVLLIHLFVFHIQLASLFAFSIYVLNSFPTVPHIQLSQLLC